MREVELSLGAAHSEGGPIVGHSGFLRRLVRPQPNPLAVPLGVPNLRRILPPRPPPHTPEMHAPPARRSRRLSSTRRRRRVISGHESVHRGARGVVAETSRVPALGGGEEVVAEATRALEE